MPASEPASRAAPTRQAIRCPKVLASHSDTGVPTIIVRISGRLASPAFIGLHPKAYWKCRISPNITPAIAIDVPIWAIAAPRTVPLVKKLRSSMGSSVRRSCQMNSASAMIAAAIDPSVTADVQPCSTPAVRV